MKRKKHSAEEIIKKLRSIAEQMAVGQSAEESCRSGAISVATYERWKSQYGGIKKDAFKRLPFKT